ncbi:MAG: hypothetical protein F6K40_11465 [Okeania sp. SIO3I5]|uniref:hypothetical protein n=1 Tax=Okeania sp. SIO3I5 TaxID=2607805 RepID=UPI0013BAAEC7|nr:hypothetical protein [Okeania sp. SIO3I5]NEQ36863.1 hypothetical protein [Okeania sp. SIO3I5]
MLQASEYKQSEYKQKVVTARGKQKLHKYVSICVGLLLLMLATFPIAYLRVSSSGKYNGGAFNSLTLEENERPELKGDR